MNNVSFVQKQVKAFNKALSRADKANILSNEVYAAISDLIDYDRMTQKGYGKAGTKYLESMTPEELMAYSADIEAAKNLLDLEKLTSQLDLATAKDPKSLLWQMYQKLEDAGYAFDSDQVRAVTEGDTNISYKEMVLKMHKYLTNPDYGLSDFNEWFDEMNALEE